MNYRCHFTNIYWTPILTFLAEHCEVSSSASCYSNHARLLLVVPPFDHLPSHAVHSTLKLCIVGLGDASVTGRILEWKIFRGRETKIFTHLKGKKGIPRLIYPFFVQAIDIFCPNKYQKKCFSIRRLSARTHSYYGA